MKHSFQSRFLAALLAVVMVFSMLPTLALAADSATWTKVELADIQPTDTVAITMTKDGTTWVLPTTAAGSSGQPLATDTGTIDGTTLTTAGDSSAFGWTITSTDGGYYIKTGDNYLYLTAANNGMRIGGTEIVWSVSEEGYLSAADSKGDVRYLGVYNSQDWRCYKTCTGTSNIADQTLGFWKLGGGDAGTEDPYKDIDAKYSVYEKVTKPTAGDTVVLYNAGSGKAVSSTASGYNLAGVDAAISDNLLLCEDDTIEWVYGETEGVSTFTQGEMKLASAPSGSYFNLTTSASDSTGWTIADCVAENNSYYVYSSELTGTYGNVYLEWYSAKNGFTAYCTGADRINEGAYGFVFYKLVREGVPEEEETDPTDPVEPVTPTGPVKAGDKVVIYNPANLKALSTEYRGFYNQGTDVTITDGVLSGYIDADVWTVGVNDDGTFTFATSEGKLLSMGTSYSSTPLDDVNTGWEISTAATEGCYYIKNAARGNYLEWYADKNNWSSYSNIGNNEALFAQAFYVVESAAPAGGFVSELTDGMQVVMYNPTYNKALSNTLYDTENSQDFVGTDVTVDGDALTGYTDANVWTVVANEDGSYSFAAADGQKLATSNRTHLGFADENNTWTLSLVDGQTDVFFVQNTVGTYLEWYNNNTRWAAYYKNSGEDLYYVRFYAVGSGSVAPSNTVATPKASPKTGEVESGTEISFTCATEGATILYKTGDGEWITYTAPIAITEDTTFTVKATKEGMDDSKEATFAYTIYVAPELGENQATLVTDVSELNSGDQILIVAQNYDYAMGTDQKTNNRGPASVIKAYDKVSYDEFAQILTLESGTEADTFALYATNGDNTGYLYCSTESGNLLRTQESKDLNASFSISIDADGVATIQAKTDKKANIIQYNTVGIFSCYGGTQNKVQIYKINDSEKPGLPEVGDTVVIYNLSAKGVLSGQDDNTDSPSINVVGAKLKDGKAVCESGAVLFSVQKNGDYYRFYNESFGYLCSNGTGNNAFYTTEASDDADWTLAEYNGGYSLESRTAKYNGKYSQYLEYYGGSIKTYSMYNVTDKDIYTFYFYPCGNDKITDGVVNTPKAIFGALAPAYAGQDYFLHFTVNALFGVKELKVMLGETELTVTVSNGEYTATIPSDLIVGEVLTVTVIGQDNKGVEINSSVDIEVKDEPVISNLTPAANAQTKENKRPTISADISNAGEDPTITMTVNGEAVAFTYENGTVSYTPEADMEDGGVTVTITVTRADGKEATKSWNFVIGEAQYQLYFGQLHSHTGEYSDGSGTLSDALSYIASLPESANVDFVAFTDHSNYFDKSGAANPEAALYDMTLATEYSQGLWSTYKSTIAAFNESQSDVVAIGGFEMTWSGGPGHLNTFATTGIVSRNNTTLNNKTSDAGMKAYYSLISQAEGVDSITQFNHPGSTFGTFTDFSYWDAVVDTRIYLVEVGNGEGQIGAGGYYPSYEYYTMALDKGWHVAPTNNQDNHKGKWGNANDARDVILAEELTEESVYDAVRNYRVYATEDKNLEIGYYVNDLPMGTIIENVPEKLAFDITLRDPDETDSIVKVELIVNSGKTAYTWDDEAVLATGHLTAELNPEYSYYYLRVTEADGDLAVTAPVWVGESLKLGISSVECGTDTPVTDEEVTISTTLFNSESSDARIKSITYTTEGAKVLGVDTTGYTLAANSTLTIDWAYVPTEAKMTTITATVVVELESKEYTFNMAVELDVLDASSLVYIGIDASHYNEYVSGNYKDAMGNFGTLAAEYSVRTVMLNTSEDLIAACGNDKYKAIILTAPSRRLPAAQTELLTYTDDELAAIVAFNNNGGTVILAGWSDNYENFPDVFGKNNVNLPAEKHMAATQNAVLEALGSSLRISDDATYDDVRSAADGVDKWRLYFSTYGDSFLTDSVIYDAEHPYDSLYTERFSHYGGASVYAVDASGNATDTLPSTVTPVVYAHETTYSVDVDHDGLGGNIPAYAYADGTTRLMAMASEQIEGKGLIIVSGAAFMSDFEVQATVDNGAEKNYSNYRICENLLKTINPVKVTTIAEVQAQTETGYKYTIEGVVTSNASGYDKDTSFFDCIYVQDETAGICCFPVAGEYKIGDVVRVTGTTDFYQGEMELQVTSIEVIGEADPVEPTAATTAELNTREYEGTLVSVRGVVSKITYANDLVESIYFVDGSGKTGRIFIDGYITSTKEITGLKEGTVVEAVGLASYDNTYAIEHDSYVRIRVRDRDDVVCSRQLFLDVPEDAYYHDAVYYLADRGYVYGTAPYYFSPNRELTRAEMITILYRVAGQPDYTATECIYSDVTAAWYYDAIMWATENGIAKGYAEGYFAPNKSINRQEMATFLYRFAQYRGEDVTADLSVLSSFPDGSNVSPFAQNAVAWSVSRELIIGTAEGTLSAKDTALRSQAVTIIARYCGKQD